MYGWLLHNLVEARSIAPALEITGASGRACSDPTTPDQLHEVSKPKGDPAYGPQIPIDGRKLHFDGTGPKPPVLHLYLEGLEPSYIF